MNKLLPIIFALSLTGCATHTGQLVSSPEFQSIAMQASMARIIEAQEHPAAVAQSIINIVDHGPLTAPFLHEAVKDAIYYDQRPASERLLIDAVFEAAQRDLANAVPGTRHEVLDQWKAAARAAAVAVLEVNS